MCIDEIFLNTLIFFWIHLQFSIYEFISYLDFYTESYILIGIKKIFPVFYSHPTPRPPSQVDLDILYSFVGVYIIYTKQLNLYMYKFNWIIKFYCIMKPWWRKCWVQIFDKFEKYTHSQIVMSVKTLEDCQKISCYNSQGGSQTLCRIKLRFLLQQWSLRQRSMYTG